MLLSLQLGNYRGKKYASKPMFIVAVMDTISMHRSLDNRIFYTDKSLRRNFERIYKYYNHTDKFYSSTFLLPYYHLGSSPFYHLVWREGVTPPSMANLPSTKFLKDNLLYTKFDDALWGLLKDDNSRNYLRQCLVNEYFKKK